jgi:hypothetical protein
LPRVELRCAALEQADHLLVAEVHAIVVADRQHAAAMPLRNILAAAH